MGLSIRRQRPTHVIEVAFVVAADMPLVAPVGSINSRFDANSLDEGESFSKLMG
jgi:hypothetical protein